MLLLQAKATACLPLKVVVLAGSLCLQVKDVEQQLPEKITITVKCPMSAYQSAVYNWIKATNTVRVDPVHRRVSSASASRDWEPLQNKVMELRKVGHTARC